MARNPGHALDIEDAVCRDCLPLGDGLGGYFTAESARKSGAPANILFRLLQGSLFHFRYTGRVAHAQLKARLSANCKQFFR
jgi:hypothetical protein